MTGLDRLFCLLYTGAWWRYFFCTHLTILLPLTFSNFLDSNNPSIILSWKILLPKATAYTFYCFQRLLRILSTASKFVKKMQGNLKNQPSSILYIYRFIITFNFTKDVTLHQVVLVIELIKVRNFCQQIKDFSIPFTFEIYNKNSL